MHDSNTRCLLLRIVVFFLNVDKFSENFLVVNNLADKSPLKLNVTFLECKKSMILAHANIITGMKSSTTLPDNDVARNDVFTAKLLDA